MKLLPMNKVEITAYRFLGGIGSCFTMCQSLIWLGLYLTGLACEYFACGASNRKRTFGYCFYLMYFHEEFDPSARLNFVNSYYFKIIMWVGVTLSVINFIISAIMLSAFSQWVNAILVKKISFLWSTLNILFSLAEVCICAVFVYDIIVIVGNDESKCFSRPDITVYNTGPAPYLLELKTNLKKLRKKIRKLKTDLHYLDVVMDEDNHIKNPFIIKSVLSNHVKDVWRDMFDTDITDKDSPKSKFLPHDKVMKNFVEKKQINLDEVDTSLLKTFDSLSNIKWVKPVEKGNVGIGVRNYPANMNLDSDSRSVEKMALLLHEYIKSVKGPPAELLYADRMLDNLTKKYLEKLNTDINYLHNTEMFKNISNKITETSGFIPSDNQDEDNILFYLKQFMEGLLSLEKDSDKLNETLFQSLVYNTKMILENGNLEIENNQMLENIKKYLRRKYNPKDFDEIPKPIGSVHRKANTSYLINELCEHCSFFILWPSILCMLFALKTGLVWVLNIVVVSLVIHYGYKVEIRRRSGMSSIIKYE